MANTQEKLRVLAQIAEKINHAGIKWAVGASTMLYLRGMVASFADLDILVSAQDAGELEALLLTMGTLHPSTAGGFQTRHFREFSIQGVEVDLIGGFVIVKDDEAYDCDFRDDQVDAHCTIDGLSIPLHSLALWQRYYDLMGRPVKADLIRAHLEQPQP